MILKKFQPAIVAAIYSCLFFFTAVQDSFPETGQGPLFQTNRNPMMFMVMTPVPRSADIQDAPFLFRLRTDYTSVHIDRESRDYDILTDMEIGVVTPEFGIKLGDRCSVDLSVPFISYGGGFMDGFLEDYHELGGFPDYGRSLRPKNEFACVVKKDDKTWFEMEQHGLHPGDARLDLTCSLTGGSRFKAALQAGVKFPTGDPDGGFGSGKTDFGVFLLTRSTFNRLVVYFNPGVIVPKDPETLGADISYRTMATLFAGFEYIKSPLWSFSAQFNGFTSPLSNTGIDVLDNPSVELALGFSRKLGKNARAAFTFCEDLSGPAPDFSVHAGVETSFGR
jgi:hypothetical protein